MSIARTSPASIGVGTALNSLASSATAGAETDTITSGTSNNIIDIVAQWKIVLGTITPSTTTRIDVFVWGTNHDTEQVGASSGSELIDGTAGTITLSSNGLQTLRFLKTTIALASGSTIVDTASIVNVLGFIPRKWGLVFTNQTGAALASSGHSASYIETYYV